MDRRVLFAAVILFAGGATGVGVAAFAFVGLDDATAETEILWQSTPANGDDGSGAVVATVDGDPAVVQPAVEGDDPVLRAIGPDGDRPWTTPLPAGAVGEISDLASGELDGDPVVAFTTGAGELVAISADDGSERFVISLASTGGVPPAFGDVTGDGQTDLAAVDVDGGVRVVDAHGDVRFETDLDGAVSLRPLIVDGEGSAADDEADESAGPNDGSDTTAGALAGSGLAVLTDRSEGQTVTTVDGGGDVVWTEPTASIVLSWNAADTTSGGVVALGGADGTLTTLETTDGSLRYTVGLQDVPVNVGGGDAGRIHVAGTGDIWAVDMLDGEVVWKQQYGGETRVNAPTAGDLTGDGTLEIIVVNREGELLGMNRNGEPVARGGIGEAIVYARPLAADLTGDGRDEVVVVTEDGTAIAVAT
ncbi:outer membrane protein assembly factor BamB family protein [Halorubrum luteum]